jgi:hypothetical protein
MFVIRGDENQIIIAISMTKLHFLIIIVYESTTISVTVFADPHQDSRNCPDPNVYSSRRFFSNKSVRLNRVNERALFSLK